MTSGNGFYGVEQREGAREIETEREGVEGVVFAHVTHE